MSPCNFFSLFNFSTSHNKSSRVLAHNLLLMASTLVEFISIHPTNGDWGPLSLSSPPIYNYRQAAKYPFGHQQVLILMLKSQKFKTHIFSVKSAVNCLPSPKHSINKVAVNIKIVVCFKNTQAQTFIIHTSTHCSRRALIHSHWRRQHSQHSLRQVWV